MHKLISFIKSSIRLSGCALGIFAFPGLLAAVFWFLFAAEILGILEELGEK